MPAKSAAQQKAAGAALAAKRGETNPSSLKGAAKEMYSSMSEQELEESLLPNAKGSLSTSRNRSRAPDSRNALVCDHKASWGCFHTTRSYGSGVIARGAAFRKCAIVIAYIRGAFGSGMASR